MEDGLQPVAGGATVAGFSSSAMSGSTRSRASAGAGASVGASAGDVLVW